MHDCALERKRERDLCSAPRAEDKGHCSDISTKTTLQNQTKISIAPNIFKLGSVRGIKGNMLQNIGFSHVIKRYSK